MDKTNGKRVKYMYQEFSAFQITLLLALWVAIITSIMWLGTHENRTLNQYLKKH